MNDWTDLIEPLKEREQQVIEGLADGLTNREIANKLFLAPSTVKDYVRKLNQKLYTNNRDEILQRVEELGLLELTSPGQDHLRPRENLPRQTTPFVGRDVELDELHAILEKEETRLLTILAPGGMGKTRIALEATEQQIDNFPDGVYFVPLQPISNTKNIIPQIANSTGYQFSNDGREPEQQILNFLSNKTLLLLMDNWEHLLDAVELINKILLVAPDVKIIATSREKLNLQAETVYVLQGMQFPEWETPEDALRYDAVQLLVQVAQRVKPDWIVTEDNLDYVARVCRLTQGMPLGILLAASWLDVYSLEAICDEIQKSADILETDMRDVPERQRSIRAIFDYSWQGLKPEEQEVFMKMSIFRGGCSPEATGAITGANSRILQGLINKALLLRNREGRHDIHELLRQYAEELLNQSDVVDEVRKLHMRYYASAMQQREAQLKDKRQIQALDDIATDYENVRIAWLCAAESENLTLLRGMLFAMDRYHSIRSRVQECDDLYLEAIHWLDSDNPEHLIMIAFIEMYRSSNLSKHRQWEQAKEIQDKYLELAMQSASLAEKFELLRMEVNIKLRVNEAVNVESVKSMIDKAKQVKDFYHEGTLSRWCGSVLLRTDITQAQQYAERGLHICIEIGETSGVGNASTLLAIILASQYQMDKAVYHFEQAVKSNASLKSASGMSFTLMNLAIAYAMLGQWSQSEKQYMEAQELVNHLVDPYVIKELRHGVSIIKFMRGDFESVEHYEAVLQMSPEERAGILNYWFRVVLFMERYDTAERVIGEIYEEQLQKGIATNSWVNVARAHLYRGLVSCFCEKYDEAIPDLCLAASEYLKAKTSTYLLEILTAFALIVADKGQLDEAVTLLACVSGHPVKVGWIQQQPKVLALLDALQVELDEAVYHVAWERGKLLELEIVIQDLLEEFGELEA